jgi:uncharacterized protein (DUF58 family)
VGPLTRFYRRARELWYRLRAWRRIHFTTGGLTFTAGAFAVGFAAVNTGNNLLHLLLGAMLGVIAVSGWFSERMIRDLTVEREVPRGVSVGEELRITYRVTSERSRMPTLALELSEEGLPDKAFLAKLLPGTSASTRSTNRFIRRGIYPLGTLTLSTGFPFGLFQKERDLWVPAELVVWPRSDRPVRRPAPARGQARRHVAHAASGRGPRGEYRALHEYRIGEDARDIHWKSSARLRTPVVREYEADARDDLWICLDTTAQPGDAAEASVEIAASLAADATRDGRSFALIAGDAVLGPGSGAAQLERALDLLARVDFSGEGLAPAPPMDPSHCVLVSVDGRGGEAYADCYRPSTGLGAA